HSHGSGDGLFDWSEKGLKKKKPKAVYTKILTPPNDEGDNPSMCYVVLSSNHPLTIKTYFCAKTAVYRCQSVECFLQPNLRILNMLFQNPAYRLARHRVFWAHCIRCFGRERSLIVEHVRAGLRNARDKGKTLGRPRKVLDAGRITALRAQGLSLRSIASELELGLPPCIVRLYPFQNSGKRFWNTIEGSL